MRVSLIYHTDDHGLAPLARLISQLLAEPDLTLELHEVEPYAYRSNAANVVASSDYIIPILTRHTEYAFESEPIWTLYDGIFQERMEAVVPVLLYESVWFDAEFYNRKPLLISLGNFSDYDKLRAIITAPRSELLYTVGAAPVRTQILNVADEASRKLLRYFTANPSELQRIDRRNFEFLIAEIFRELGYDTEVTAATRDGGRDIIAIKRAEVDLRCLIECKRPDPGGYVGVSAVRELLGVKHSERATKGILATTAYLSKDAKVFVEQNRWELEAREYEGLLDWLESVKAKSGGA